MNQYIVFDQNTGEVIRAVLCSAAQAEYQISGPGEAMIEFAGDVDPAGLERLYVFGGQVLQRPARPTPEHTWNPQAQTWEADAPAIASVLALRQVAAQAQIDDAAGRARLRYITDVPGQQATYQRKEQQAREWTGAGYPEPAPSFIAAEAEALDTTPQAIAQQVIALADYWAYVKGPEIEASRIKHKAAVRSATSLEAVQAALDAAMAELEAL